MRVVQALPIFAPLLSGMAQSGLLLGDQDLEIYNKGIFLCRFHY